MSFRTHPISIFAALLIGAATLSAFQAAAEPADTSLARRAKAVFGTLPYSADARAALGQVLYSEKRLSKNHDIACASCHRLDKFGVDGEATSPGHKGQRGGRNSPTTFNAALHFTQFWDGRAVDVEDQAKGPVLNPIEMAMPDAASVETVLKSIPGYAPLFKAAFPGDKDPISFDNMAIAIAAFERQLLTPSPFDAFLDGDAKALNGAQRRGLEVFMNTGCITCHNGAAIGGGSFQKLGLIKPYETEDTGRFEVTGDPKDKYFFKVPSLRNIAKTGPYFHDGSIKTLEEAVRIMAEHQLGRTLSKSELGDVVAFLGSLTGTIDPKLVATPEFPPSGPNTPKPDPN